MKEGLRLLSAILVAGLMITTAGCPKKQAITPVPEPMPEPVWEPKTETPVELNLATAYFDYDDAAVRPSEAVRLETNTRLIKAAADRGVRPQVTLEGHCCPIGTAAYNMALGLRRAESVKAFLVRLGVPESQLTTISYGEEKTVTTDENRYDLNRRVEARPAPIR